jgi:hypothetical protein
METMLIHWARRAGLAAGLIASVVAVAGWRMAPAGGSLPLQLSVSAQPSAQLATSASGRIFGMSSMNAGDSVEGELRVRNITGVALPLSLRMRPSIADVDRSLAVRVDAGGRTLYDGPLGGLRHAPSGARLASGATATLRLVAHLPAAASGWQGRVVQAPLVLVTR